MISFSQGTSASVLLLLFFSLSGVLLFHLFNKYLLGNLGYAPKIQREQDRRLHWLPERQMLAPASRAGDDYEWT